MGRYIARRLLQALPVFFGTTFLIFSLVFAIPGDPIRALSGDKPISPSVYAELQDRYNLNDPFLVQYGKYMGNLFQGDFGQSFRGREVTEILKERFPVTIKLALTAFLIEILIGISAGVLAGLRRGSFMDNLVLISTTIVVSIPVFLGTTFLIFALVFAIPGDPIRALSGDKPISPSVYAELQERYNLNDPFLVQYGKYMGNLLQGDFGQSFRGREEIGRAHV